MPSTVSKTPVPDRRCRGGYGCTRNTDEQESLPLGHRCSRRSFGLRRNRRDVFTAGFHSTHLARYRMVHHRHIERHDLGFLAMALGSIVWGNLSDRFGPRRVVLTGSTVLAGALALASRASSLFEFQLIFGLAVGGATAAIFAPMMACVTGWFDTHRSLAVSLVSAGMGMAPMTMAPLAARLISNHDWRTSLQILAALTAPS